VIENELRTDETNFNVEAIRPRDLLNVATGRIDELTLQKVLYSCEPLAESMALADNSDDEVGVDELRHAATMSANQFFDIPSIKESNAAAMTSIRQKQSFPEQRESVREMVQHFRSMKEESRRPAEGKEAESGGKARKLPLQQFREDLKAKKIEEMLAKAREKQPMQVSEEVEDIRPRAPLANPATSSLQQEKVPTPARKSKEVSAHSSRFEDGRVRKTPPGSMKEMENRDDGAPPPLVAIHKSKGKASKKRESRRDELMLSPTEEILNSIAAFKTAKAQLVNVPMEGVRQELMDEINKKIMGKLMILLQFLLDREEAEIPDLWEALSRDRDSLLRCVQVRHKLDGFGRGYLLNLFEEEYDAVMAEQRKIMKSALKSESKRRSQRDLGKSPNMSKILPGRDASSVFDESWDNELGQNDWIRFKNS
jgi:hypothetical protein